MTYFTGLSVTLRISAIMVEAAWGLMGSVAITPSAVTMNMLRWFTWRKE